MWTKIFYRNLYKTQSPLLAGHSKWANIKHTKAEKDGEKSVSFAKLARFIRLAIQEGGSPDPALNTPLRNIIDVALRKNMPMSTIQNNIKRSITNKTELKKHRFEFRYKQKVFTICTIYTDNLPALRMEITPIIKKAGATFADISCMFDDFGLIEASVSKNFLTANNNTTLEQRAIEDAIECGAEDVYIENNEIDTNIETGHIVNFFCNPIELKRVSKLIGEKGYCVENAEHFFKSKNSVMLSAEEQKAYDIFLKKLRNLAGFDGIYDNVAVNEGS